MKALVLVTALGATLALAAASAVPAEAANTKKKKVGAVRAPVATHSYRERVPPSRQHPYGVYGADGELLGMDPDPNIRMMIRRDPKPWDNNS
jgi:hypothetical protein